MKSFGITVAFVFAALSAGVVGALPTGSETLLQRDGNFLFPIPRPAVAAPAVAISASGANGGHNVGGNGANGGTISIKGRDEDLFWPWYSYPAAVKGPISASGANGGYNYGGNGANGGSISINSRAEEEKLVKVLPWYWNLPLASANGHINVSGANGGTNYYGDGANGGSISVNSREDNGEETKQFWPFGQTYYPPAAFNGAITASGANGGYNYGGSGANGGDIAINARDEHVWPPPYGPSRNSVNGQNTGFNTGSVGALSGGGFYNTVSGYNGGVNHGALGAMHGGGYLNSVNGVNTGTNVGSVGTSSGGGSQNSVNGMNSGYNSGTVGSISN